MSNVIEYLKIENFRSIDVLELHDIKPFSVFAGANGSGKSNFFDALDFVSRVLRFDLEEALAYHGGVENIVCWRRDEEARKIFRFEVKFSHIEFGFSIDFINNKNILNKERNEKHFAKLMSENNRPTLEKFLHANNLSINMDLLTKEIIFKLEEDAKKKDVRNINNKAEFLLKYQLYRIDPNEARKTLHNQNPKKLNKNGSNLSSVLERIEADSDIRYSIIDWLTLIVPNFKDLKLEKERLTNTTVLAFQEESQDHYFPPHLISDGTMYLLCLLVAVLDRNPDKPEPILIEEPERGLHPKAILELTGFFREHATLEQPIWLTTHNESLVRGLQSGELWLVDKVDGATQMKKVEWDDMPLPLDQAWLANALSGGLPW